MKTIDFVLNIPKETKLVNLCTGMVHHASEFISDITIGVEGSTNNLTIDLKSILGVMSLCMSNGKKIHIEINGPDEDGAFMSINKYVEQFEAK